MTEHVYNEDTLIAYDPHSANQGHGRVFINAPVSSSAKETKSLDNASIWDALGNLFTGNLDYKRQIESAMRAEERSAYEAQKAREFSAQEAEKNRRWQERMSDSAYSRAIADLKRNGLNPYAVGSFGAASTPSGATGTAYAGSGYAGTQFRTSAEGFKMLTNLVTTAYKEQKQAQRDALNLLPRIISAFFGD